MIGRITLVQGTVCLGGSQWYRGLGDWEDYSGTGEHWVIGRITVVQENTG